MTIQLGLHGAAFKTVDKLYSAAILEQIDDALKKWASVKSDVTDAEVKEVEEMAELEEKVEKDSKALVAKVRAFDRKFGGYYGTGF